MTANINLVDHVQNALSKTVGGENRLPGDVLNLEGFSGNLGRAFLNHLCNFPEVKYLEIGCCKGSTLVSASYDNSGTFQTIDNFSQFGGTFQHMLWLKDKYKDHLSFDVFCGDCWEFDKTQLATPFNVYFNDGPHGYEDHKMGITHYADVLTDQSVIVVDDWNDKSRAVQNGTRDGIKEAGLSILFEREIGHETDSDRQGWWNGFGIFVVQKSGG